MIKVYHWEKCDDCGSVPPGNGVEQCYLCKAWVCPECCDSGDCCKRREH